MRNSVMVVYLRHPLPLEICGIERGNRRFQPLDLFLLLLLLSSLFIGSAPAGGRRPHADLPEEGEGADNEAGGGDYGGRVELEGRNLI